MIRLSSRSWARTVPAAIIGAGIVLALHSGGHFIRRDWLLSLLWLAAAFGIARWWGRRSALGDDEEKTAEITPALALFTFLLVYLYSSAAGSRAFYFLDWVPGEGVLSLLLTSPPAIFSIASALLTVLLLRFPGRTGLVVLSALLLCQAAAFWGLYAGTAGAPLYSDDHPSFMLRLWIYAKTFPKMVYYNPFWNGGRASQYLVASGASSIGSVLWPLWKFGAIEKMYTPAVGLFFTGIVPWVSAASVRIVGGSWRSAFTAAILSLGISQFFFLWLLKFGTVGANAASLFALPVAALLYRVIKADRVEILPSVLLVICSFIFFAWPASVFTALALLLGAAATVRVWWKHRTLILLVCAAATILLCLPSALVLLRHSAMGSFAQADLPSPEKAEILADGWRRLRSHLTQAHPLLVFLGIGGVWFLREREKRLFFGPILAGLLLLAGWGESWKPQFQLSRMGIPLFSVAILPAALWIGRILDDRRVILAPVRAALLALLILGGVNSARIYGNQGRVPYRAINSETSELVEWIKAETPPESRILFAGPTVHAFGGGHVAPLPVLADREMMATDYYHFSPKMTEYNYPPRDFRKPAGRVFEFMQLYNVSHVITYHSSWMKFFRKRPDQYEVVRTFGDKRKKKIFKVKQEYSWFFAGSGEVDADIGRITVTVEEPEKEIILKYNWADGLEADPPVTLRPHTVEEGVTFIAASPNGRREFDIRYRKWW